MIRPSLRRGRGPAARRSCKDAHTGPGYYDTPVGGIWWPVPSLGGRPEATQPARDGPFAIGHHNAP